LFTYDESAADRLNAMSSQAGFSYGIKGNPSGTAKSNPDGLMINHLLNRYAPIFLA
jgi:hypothetical protein